MYFIYFFKGGDIKKIFLLPFILFIGVFYVIVYRICVVFKK